MKITVTGSLGRISQPLVKRLLQERHQVTVISSDPAKRSVIESMGARAAIGSVEELAFLTNAFTGADVAYCMLPPFPFAKDPQFDYRNHTRRIIANYAEAVKGAGVPRVIHLSSIGADMAEGSGLLIFHHIAEQLFREKLPGVAITHMRPVGFYYNLYEFLDPVRGKGFMGSFIGKILTVRHYGLRAFLHGQRGLILSNYGGEDRMPWVAPEDIADAIADEIGLPGRGIRVRYVASQELSCNEIAAALGRAIGKPYLKWELISDKQMLGGLKQFKLPDALASAITEMNAGMHNGRLFKDYYANRPALGKVKINDFAREFAKAYNAGA